MDLEPRLCDLAAKQHRLVAVSQAYDLGCTRESLRHAVRSGGWDRVTTRVLGRVGAPATEFEPLMAAVLHHGPNAYIGRETALALWGLPGFDLDPVHVLSTRSVCRRSTDVARLHSTRDLLATHVTDFRGIPASTPIRAIFDIASGAHPMKVERALDTAWARRLVTYPLLQRTLRELADRGRTGITLMRALAAARPASYRPPESNTERRVNELLERTGERPLRRQVNLGTQTNWVGRIDLVDDELPLSVEVQSDLFHGSRLDRQRDKARIAELRASGFEVVEAWESDVWRDGKRLVADIRDARRRAKSKVLGIKPVA